MPLDVTAELGDEGGIGPPRVLGDEELGAVVEVLRRLHEEDGVGGVRGGQDDVGIGGLELAHHGVEAGRLGAVGHLQRHVVAGFPGQLLLHLGGVGAEERVLVHDAERLDLHAAALFQVLHEVEHREAEVPVVGGGAEEPLETPLGERGGRGLGVHEGHAVALGNLARGGGDAGVVGAEERAHLLLGDEPLRVRLAHLRLALVVRDHEPDLGAAQPGQPFGPGQGQGEIVLAVDDLRGQPDGVHAVDPHLGHRARQRIGDTDHHVLGLGVSEGGHGAQHGEGDHEHASHECPPGVDVAVAILARLEPTPTPRRVSGSVSVCLSESREAGGPLAGAASGPPPPARSRERRSRTLRHYRVSGCRGAAR